MARNLEFIADVLYPDQKIIVWAHNAHISKRGYHWRSAVSMRSYAFTPKPMPLMDLYDGILFMNGVEKNTLIPFNLRSSAANEQGLRDDWYQAVRHAQINLFRDDGSKVHGFSVRCIQDE